MQIRYLYGIYDSIEEATVAQKNLLEHQIPEGAIYLLSKEDYLLDDDDRTFETETEVLEDNYLYLSDLENFELWTHEASQNLELYDLQPNSPELLFNEGKILVLVDGEYEGQLSRLNVDQLIAQRAADRKNIRVDAGAGEDYHHKITLHGERLNIVSSFKEYGNVRLSKKVVEEVKTIEVPLRREELHVTYVKLDEEGNEYEETEKILLSYEEAYLDRETISVEEVDIKKVIDIIPERITDNVLREKILLSKHDNNEL